MTSPAPEQAADRAAPPIDPTARFIDLQQQLLTHYGSQATSRYVQLRRPPLRLHLLESGQGEPIVLFHGGDGEAVTWAPLLAELEPHAHLFAVDRPGCGLSDAFDYRRADLRAHAAACVESILDALDLPTATVMGGSMGGFFALAGALALPERVTRVVLAGYPVGLTRAAPLPLRIVATVPGLSRRFMRSVNSLEGQRNQYRRMFHVDPDTVPELYFRTRLAGLALPSERDTWPVLLQRVASLRGLRREVYLGDELGRIQAPVLVLWGDHDMAPLATGQRATGMLPHGQFVHLPGVGHFPALEAPRRCAELIAAFLAEDVPAVADGGGAS